MKLEKHYPGLCEERTPSGKTRWRVHIDGQKRRKLTLPVEPGHLEFEDHYLAARAGERFSKPLAPKIGKHTLDAFCEDFTAWMKVQAEAGNLRPLTLGSRITASRQARGCPSPNGKMRMGTVTADLHGKRSFTSGTPSVSARARHRRASRPSAPPTPGARTTAIRSGAPCFA